MRKILLLTMCGLVTASGMLLAESPKADTAAQLEKLRVLRTSLLNKMPAFGDLFDGEHNGANTAANSLSAKWTESTAALRKRIETEDAKTGDAKDKAVVDALNAKLARFQTLWSDRNQTDWVVWRQKMNTLSTARGNLVYLVNDLSNLDQYWLRADCDRALLISVLTEVDRRVEEVKTEATALLDGYIKQCATDEHTLQE